MEKTLILRLNMPMKADSVICKDCGVKTEVMIRRSEHAVLTAAMNHAKEAHAVAWSTVDITTDAETGDMLVVIKGRVS